MSKFLTIIVLLLISLFMAISICLLFEDALTLGVYNCYIFFLDWSFDHYIVSILVSCNSLYFKIYVVQYKYCYSSFLLISICAPPIIRQSDLNFAEHSPANQNKAQFPHFQSAPSESLYKPLA